MYINSTYRYCAWPDLGLLNGRWCTVEYSSAVYLFKDLTLLRSLRDLRCLDYDADHEMANLHPLVRINLDRNIVGVTCILNEVYVITENCDTVDVYFFQGSYKLNTSVSICDMLPTDIATSYADVCVYVLDGNNVCIWRIHRQLKTTKECPLNVRPGEVMKSMSITKKGVIVVVLSGNAVLMYNPFDGEMKRILVEGVGSSEGGTGIAHAVEIDDHLLLACNDRETFVYDLERAEVRKDMVIGAGGGNHITLKNSKCAIITGGMGKRMRMLDMKKWETRDIDIRVPVPIAVERKVTYLIRPTHAHSDTENGQLYVFEQNYLYVYRFDEIDTESHLAESKTRPECQASSSGNSVYDQGNGPEELAVNNRVTAGIRLL